MKIFRKIFDFYLDGSIHVALSCFCLVRISQYQFNISKDFVMAYFAFFGTIVGYNFVKFVALFSDKQTKIQLKLKGILALSILSFLGVGFCFFQLQKSTQIIAIVFLIFTLLYTLPFFPNRKNARNWAGVKIYIVSLCWVGVTLVLPALNAKIPVAIDFFVQCTQRFILIFVLILIFEIIDLAKDDPYLQTVPQQIGLKRTKILGCGLLLIFCALEIFIQSSNFLSMSLIIAIVIAIVILLFLAFANETRSKYYTSFWVESIPILWCILLLLL
ncbi:UbiA prenyltransferase family protein [Flavobacterium nackdongense]|uniref:Prenyltransferase n=1 Tax=Flavobacterium nackdongense TaxID=2547394 RepID=A0A4P6YGI4_9FLAO|nr:hypothetical protein [Flavobacterium nackdongense]QBN19927.1 hypothetical protein E1750_14345 [Flavobacterium nackdongense]